MVLLLAKLILMNFVIWVALFFIICVDLGLLVAVVVLMELFLIKFVLMDLVRWMTSFLR